jgi:L-cystine transport system ATP-binding protein
MSAVEARALSKRFGDTTVLADVDLAIEEGEVVAVIGPSGSGKTTLLRCLNCLEYPDSGCVRIGPIALDASEPWRRRKEKARRLRASAGFVFQQFNLFPHRTALGNVIEGPLVVRRLPRAEAEAQGRALLARVGLAEKADAYPSRLSGGQQQRVAIARALAMEPMVLLFDEPTSALDPELVGEVLTVIRELAAERRTMVIVTHEMRFAREVADRVVFMDAGRIVEEAPSADFFDTPRSTRAARFLQSLGAG